jgi:hypothetical protein
MPKNTRKFQMVVDDETQTILDQLKEWTNEDRKTALIKLGLKELHWRISEQRKGRQVVSKPNPPGITVFDPLTK